MNRPKRSLLYAFAYAGFHSSPAMADLHIYTVTTANPGTISSKSVVYVYNLGKSNTYRIRAQAVSSKSINLAQAANEHKDFPLAVSAGGFTANSRPVGLISVQRSFLSPPASAQTLPTLICFTLRGFQIRRAPTDAELLRLSSGCLAAVQSMPLLIDDGKKLRTETRPLSWGHVFVGRAAVTDMIVIVEGTMSAAALSEFLAGSGRACPAPTGSVTKHDVRLRVLRDGEADASCTLGLNDVATLNLGTGTGAVHYGTRLAGDDASSPPIALLFDD